MFVLCEPAGETASFLNQMRARAPTEPGLWRRPDGQAYYEAALANETTMTMTPRDVHETGLQRVKELQAQMDVALRALGLMQEGVGPRLTQLAADPRFRYPDAEEGRAQVLADMKSAQARIEARMNLWFAARARAALAFRTVQDSAPLGQPTAFYQPPRPSLKQPGLVLVDVRDIAVLPRFDVTTLVAPAFGTATPFTVSAVAVFAAVLEVLVAINSSFEMTPLPLVSSSANMFRNSASVAIPVRPALNSS